MRWTHRKPCGRKMGLCGKKRRWCWLAREAVGSDARVGNRWAHPRRKEKLSAKNEELVAVKADLDDERACRKGGEENLVASKTNVATQRRRGDKAVLKAGEMEGEGRNVDE